MPGRVVKRDNVRLPQQDLDQVSLPDPVKQEIEQLKRECTSLRMELEALQNEKKTKEEKE